jgi:hypothetical protein
MLAKRLDEVIKALNNARQPVQRPPKQPAMSTQPATTPPIQVAYQPNFRGPPFHLPPSISQPLTTYIVLLLMRLLLKRHKLFVLRLDLRLRLSLAIFVVIKDL